VGPNFLHSSPATWCLWSCAGREGGGALASITLSTQFSYCSTFMRRFTIASWWCLLLLFCLHFVILVATRSSPLLAGSNPACGIDVFPRYYILSCDWLMRYFYGDFSTAEVIYIAELDGKAITNDEYVMVRNKTAVACLMVPSHYLRRHWG
jgi:hypothetical protein